MTQKKRQLFVHCPSCKKKISYYDSKYRPFCSKNCSLNDLQAWNDEEYALPTTELPTVQPPTSPLDRWKITIHSDSNIVH